MEFEVDSFYPSTLKIVELEGITLSEIRQSEEDKYHMISLKWRIQETRQKSIGEGRKKMKQDETREGDRP